MSEMQTVYCVPIDETGKEVEDDAVIQLPLDNVFTQQQSTNTLLRMLLNFGGISILIIGTMFGTPFIYKIFISNIIKNNGGEQKIDRLTTCDSFASILIITTSILMLTGFLSTFNDELVGMSGIFFIIIFFIAFARIQFEKTKGPVIFYSEYLGLHNQATWGRNLFSSEFVNDNIIYIGGGVLLAVIIICIYSLYLKKNPNPGLLFFCIWIIPYLKSFLIPKTDKEK